MQLCKDCKHLVSIALAPEMGRCSRITDQGGSAVVLGSPTSKWACLYVSNDFGCVLFEAKA